MHIVRQAAFAATPWRNGGGITHEVMRVPPLGDSFDWRVSVAEVDSPGPFSDFSGYRRFMVLLRGSGVRLTFAGGKPLLELRAAGDMAEFDGATAVHCELLGGACADLNFIVSRALQGAQARILRVTEPRTLRVPVPAASDPAAGDPAVGGPAACDRAASGPTARDPAVGGPAACDRAAGDPAARDPVAGDPAACDRAAGDPVAPSGTAAPDPAAPIPAAPAPADQGQTVLLFAVSGAVSLIIGDQEPVTLQAWDFAVHTWDYAVAASRDPLTIGPATPGAGAPLVLLATVDNNSSRAASPTFRG